MSATLASNNVCVLCGEQRDLVEALGDDQDPAVIDALADWHAAQHPGSGPFTPADPGDGWAGRATQADTVDLKVFEVGKHEVKCAQCHLIHPAGKECW